MTEWPALTSESRRWESRVSPDAVPRRVWDVMREPYTASRTAPIASLSFALPPTVTAESDDASAALVRFDSEVGHINAPFASILLRSESASSSQIENLTSGARAIGEAELGERTDGNATLIVSNVRAMTSTLDLADNLSESAIIEMQTALLERTSPELTGKYRAEQVWIGGNDFSPHGASFVPPHQDRVPAAMADLVEFATRSDLPALAHTAIAHAQFETIHPFPDGNGRTGRALVHAMLRRSGLTRNVTVPVSAGLLQQRDRYFDALTKYRAGDIGPIVEVFSSAVFLAIDNGRTLASDLLGAQEGWREKLRGVRSSSTAHRLVALVLEHPVLNSKLVEERLTVPPKTAIAALTLLESHGILTLRRAQSRNRVWTSPQVLTALDAFATRSIRQP